MQNLRNYTCSRFARYTTMGVLYNYGCFNQCFLLNKITCTYLYRYTGKHTNTHARAHTHTPLEIISLH